MVIIVGDMVEGCVGYNICYSLYAVVVVGDGDGDGWRMDLMIHLGMDM